MSGCGIADPLSIRRRSLRLLLYSREIQQQRRTAPATVSRQRTPEQGEPAPTTIAQVVRDEEAAARRRPLYDRQLRGRRRRKMGARDTGPAPGDLANAGANNAAG